jgi:hypothetical protein
MRPAWRVRVTRETCGWTVRIGAHIYSSCGSRHLALGQACGLARALRGHGEAVELAVDDEGFALAPESRA